jgi:choline dehydrogenase-like flavoprotein
MESIPNPESRITLSDKKDALGNRQIDLHWQLTQQDLESYCRFADLLHNGLRGLGFQIRDIRHDVDPEGWPVSMIPAKHQLGTTRMHRDPRLGVVDPDCRVHGVENLYVASGSVFPTGGMANPTLTIIALAVRLADHLKHKRSS